MSEQVIKLSTNAAERIKEIMSKAEDKAIGVRVGVKSGGCAGMSYVMEYARDIKPNEEVIEEKGVKVLIDPKAIMYLLGTEMDYKIEISDEKKVNIEMTLTSPNCPVAESLPKMVKDNVLKIEEVSDVDLKLVWSPSWTKDMMSEAAKLELNL